MALTLTYNDNLSRVEITADELAAADYATVERSTDGVSWVTVRGGSNVAVTSGAFAIPVYDYEFPLLEDGGPIFYRVRGHETDPITFVAVGTGTSGNNTSLVPALPAGIVAGDLLVILASIRNSGTGTVNTPTGWTVMRTFGNVTLLGRRYQAGDTAPTVTFSGGVAGADTLARMAAFRSAELAPVTGVDLLNSSAQDIAYPALTIPSDDLAVIDVAWKQDDYTGNTARTTPGSWTSIGGISATAGDDAAMSWWYSIQTTAANLTSGTHTVTGGGAAISRAMVVALEHAEYLNEQIEEISPIPTGFWLKSIARPFLNMQVDVRHTSPAAITRPARVGVFDVVGRSFPVAVSDVRKSRRWTLRLNTETQDESDLLELLLASGDILYLQTTYPCTMHIPGGYIAAGDATVEWHPLRPLNRTWTMPVTEVAAPGPEVVGATVTWQSVVNAFGSWSELLASESSWADVLTLVGSPTEVIVP